MRTGAAAVIAVAALALMAGCGQKGPLYLPDKGAAVVRGPPVATPGQPPPAAPGPAASPPAPAAPAVPPAPKPDDKDQDSQPKS